MQPLTGSVSTQLGEMKAIYTFLLLFIELNTKLPTIQESPTHQMYKPNGSTNPYFFRLATESGAVLGGGSDLLYHPAGTVLGGYGGLCRS